MTVEEIKDEIRSIQRRRDLESHGSERVLACTADAIHVLQYCKGPPQQSHSDYWRDSFGAKTNINRIEDVIAWAELPRPFHLPSGQ